MTSVLSSGRPAAWRLSLAVGMGLALLVILVYWGSGTHGFIFFDDDEYVSANPNVAAGLTAAGVRWAFTSFYAANWHPVTWLSHMLDMQLFGMNPGAAHRVNVFLHASNTVLLFLVLSLLTKTTWRSAFVAALFGIHPLHVESVAWISERKDLLSTLFLLLTIAAYAMWVSRRRKWLFAAALVACTVGLMSKPMLVTTPVLLLLVDFWPLRRFEGEEGTRSTRSIFFEKVPFLILVVGTGVATWLAQSRGGAIAVAATFPPAQRVANALVSYVRYLRDMVWPDRLAIFYPHPASVGNSIPLVSWGPAVILLAFLTWIALRHPRQRPWLAFGWGWYVLALVPVIGLVQVGSQARGDRYTYIPLIGIFTAIVWGIEEAAFRMRVPRQILWAVAVACVLALGGAARIQNGYWKDEVSLDVHAIQVTKANWVAWNNLGKHYMDFDYPRAAECFHRAIGYKDDYSVAWYNLGVVLGGLRRDAEAVATYRRSLELDPANADGWLNLSFEYQAVGNLPDAVSAAEEALRLQPDRPAALESLVISYWDRGDLPRARAAFDRLKAVDPPTAERLASQLKTANEGRR